MRFDDDKDEYNGSSQVSYFEDGKDLPKDLDEGDVSFSEKKEGIPGLDENEALIVDNNSDLEEKVTDWENDKDPSKFIEYAEMMYRTTPAHNGRSVAGAERALVYLTNLNREFSVAIRKDVDQALDIEALETLRSKLNIGMLKLSDLMKSLQKEMKTNHQTKVANWSDRPKVVITAFENAITSMIINGVITNGYSIESLFDFLSEKYELTNREELAIVQILKDMGQPIHLDRSSISSKPSDEKEGFEGVDFVENYLA